MIITNNQQKTEENSKALINAIVDMDLDLVGNLVKVANVNYKDPLGMKPVHYVIRLYPDRTLYAAVKMLKDNGADLNATDHFGDRPV